MGPGWLADSGGFAADTPCQTQPPRALACMGSFSTPWGEKVAEGR
jgi:hypothetical protein